MGTSKVSEVAAPEATRYVELELVEPSVPNNQLLASPFSKSITGTTVIASASQIIGSGSGQL